MIAGSDGLITIPIPAFVVDHPDGLFVFDTGFSRAVYRDVDAYYPEEALKHVEFHFTPEQELSAQMQRAGLDPSRVMLLANSHLHYDHCGGNEQFPQATVLVQRAEWDAANAAPEDSRGFRVVDFHTGQRLQFLDGEHDVFGDGSVVLVQTHGHTAGHQSLRIQHEGGVAVLTGDACYMRQTLVEEDALPDISVTHDAGLYQKSLQSLRELHRDGVSVYVGHDPAFWDEQPLAPLPLFG
jgi:N-acyl homoserine lactone hydrolase